MVARLCNERFDLFGYALPGPIRMSSSNFCVVDGVDSILNRTRAMTVPDLKPVHPVKTLLNLLQLAGDALAQTDRRVCTVP